MFRCDNEPSILALLRAVKLAWQWGSTGNVCRGRPAVQRRCRKFGKNVIKGMSDRSSWRSSPVSVLKYRWIMTSCFAIGRDWKTACELRVCVVGAAAAITTRRLGPLDSPFEHGRYLGPMDGSNTVLIGTASGVLKARTIKWLPPGERWNGSLLDETRGQNWDQGTRAARPCLSHHHQCHPTGATGTMAQE